MTEKFRDTLRLWNAVATQADRTVAGTARRTIAGGPTTRPQALDPATSRVAKMGRRAVACHIGKCAKPHARMPAVLQATAYCLPMPPLQTQADVWLEEQQAGPSMPAEQQQQQQPQLWQRFVLSRKAVAIGAGLGAGAALVLWSGGLLVVPALHLAGIGAAGVKAGTVAAAVHGTLGTSLAAGGVCAAACQTAGGAAAVPLMSNAVLSAAGGTMLGGAGVAASLLPTLLYMRGLVEGQKQGQRQHSEEEEGQE